MGYKIMCWRNKPSNFQLKCQFFDNLYNKIGSVQTLGSQTSSSSNYEIIECNSKINVIWNNKIVKFTLGGTIDTTETTYTSYVGSGTQLDFHSSVCNNNKLYSCFREDFKQIRCGCRDDTTFTIVHQKDDFYQFPYGLKKINDESVVLVWSESKTSTNPKLYYSTMNIDNSVYHDAQEIYLNIDQKGSISEGSTRIENDILFITFSENNNNKYYGIQKTISLVQLNRLTISGTQSGVTFTENGNSVPICPDLVISE